MATGEIDINRYKLETEESSVPGSISHPCREQTPREEWTQQKELGEGGFGVVYLQKEATTGKLRAVKSMHIRQLLLRNIDVKRELVSMIAVMDHPDLFIQFQNWYEDRNYIHLAMEYVKGGNLDQLIRKQGSKVLSSANAAMITGQLLKGLIILHEKGICHRDLKPENVLISSEDPLHVKLADFGISKSTIGTNPRTSIGTAGYLAPEVRGFRPKGYMQSNEYTSAVDIWALGCLVHKMLTSDIPFWRATEANSYSNAGSYIIVQDPQPMFDMDSFSQFCKGNIPLPIQHLRNLNPDAASFVEGLLAYHPDNRPTPMEARYHLWLI